MVWEAVSTHALLNSERLILRRRLSRKKKLNLILMEKYIKIQDGSIYCLVLEILSINRAVLFKILKGARHNRAYAICALMFIASGEEKPYPDKARNVGRIVFCINNGIIR
jgi:hypothetical protein